MVLGYFQSARLFFLLTLCSVWLHKTANHSFTLDSDVFEYIKVNPCKEALKQKTKFSITSALPWKKGAVFPGDTGSAEVTLDKKMILLLH